MFFDYKLYETVLLESNDHQSPVQSYLFPLIIKNNNEFSVSKIILEEYTYTLGSSEFKKKTNHIELNIRGNKIAESNVFSFKLFLPTAEGNSIYAWQPIDRGNIFEYEDFDDFFIIIERLNTKDIGFSTSYDFVLYRNCEKVHTIENAKSIVMRDRRIDVSSIVFTRESQDKNRYARTDNWLYANGAEKSESELNLSLLEWDNVFGNAGSIFSLTALYDSKNDIPVESPSLLWDTTSLVKWTCPFGHKWEESIQRYTSGDYSYSGGRQNYCPKCSQYLRGVQYNTPAEQALHIVELFKKAFLTFKTTSVKTLRDRVKLEFNDLLGRTEIGSVWIDETDMPSTVEYYFLYPNGKHGDIDRYICEEYGSISQVDEFLYKGIISTDNADILELFEESYGNSNFEKYSEYLKNAKFNEFLVTHNIWFRLRFLSSLVKHLQDTDIDSFAFDRRMTQYRSIIRKKRNEFYSKIVAESKASRKWVAEQTLYQFIKSVYPDAIFQYTAEWLGLQSLDIYVPSLRVGIEYQGQQHYLPIALFGGEEGLKKRVLLDESKRNKCHSNNVKLFEWKYDMVINPETINSFVKLIAE